jgi:hypothetical protein
LVVLLADLNFLTIHGKSRFPGLFVWSREGKKLNVKVPHGCLLLQVSTDFKPVHTVALRIDSVCCAGWQAV